MLLLTRRVEQEVFLHLENGETIILKILPWTVGKMTLGISAPESVRIERDDAINKRRDKNAKMA